MVLKVRKKLKENKEKTLNKANMIEVSLWK
jgi:hypothetical protein